MTPLKMFITVGAVVTAAGAIAGGVSRVLSAQYVPRSEFVALKASFALYTHDDSARHLYSVQRRDAIQRAIDSIEVAHQRQPDRGRVLQAGNPR